MARIPTSDIDQIKREADLVALARSRGIEMKKHGSRDFVGKCPFHDDNDSPNFIISPAKGLYHCMACGAAGNAIQFVEKFDGVSFRHAYELLANGGKAVFENGPKNGKPRKKATVPALACPLDLEADDGTLLDQVSEYYHERLGQSKAALDYLASRGLDDDDLVKKFRIGYADRTLGLRLPAANRKDGAAIRERLQELGVFRKESGHEHFNGSLVFPIVNGDEHVAEIYGRKITRGLRKGTPNHLYLPGPHHGIFNPDALKKRDLILCESILDALTFIRHGMENVTCIYGTQGFTDELFTAIKAANLDAVRIAYDADDSGELAAKRDAERLQKIGVECFRVRFPLGEDANSYALAAGGDALKKAVRSAAWLGLSAVASAKEGSGVAPAPVSSLAAELVAKEADEVKEIQEAIEQAKEATKNKKVGEPLPPVVNLVSKGDHYELQLGERLYRVGGLEKNNSLEVLKITLRVSEPGGLLHVDAIDLYRDGDRRKFIERAAEELRLEKELIKRDLGKLLLALEAAQEERLSQPLDAAESVVKLSAEEEAEAKELLQAPDLIQQLTAKFASAGLVGEQTNVLASYLACSSRKLDKPLAIIIQSTSAAGKSALMEAVLSFFPSEEQIKYSAMTGQSLYYLGEKNLKHKILAIVEEEGAEKASYALKLLQSEGELTIASTGKDANTGRMETQEYHVEGPVAIILTTTSIDIDEELMNRCLVLTVDESKEQTERIHEMQRKARTLEGLRIKKRRAKILTLLQNAQRLLNPVAIINPFADELTFTAERTRTRRDHEKYLTLIEAVTLLHQHQRPLEDDAEAGPHIKSTLEDIEVANKIAPEVLGRSLDELPPQSRRLLASIKSLVRAKMKELKIEQDLCHFSRRELRDFTNWSQTQIRRHLERLNDFEYIALRGGRNGVAIKYELLVDVDEESEGWKVGLINVEKLRRKQQGKDRKDKK
ncbi:MAG: CHC2 zinc finger domain-containing protein [Verrucomicrobiales bacterium]|nr:CHC2 zinc finger domain-containing protein [Verrucomicrobiales bacterium]